MDLENSSPWQIKQYQVFMNTAKYNYMTPISKVLNFLYQNTDSGLFQIMAYLF